MRAKSATRGDGSPAGIHVPVAGGRDRITEARRNGPCLRGRYARRNQSAFLAAHEGHSHVVLPGGRRAGNPTIDRDGTVMD